MSQTSEAIEELITLVTELELGKHQQIGNAHFIPLIDNTPKQKRDYITVHEALEKGTLDLRDSGRIDALIVKNRGDKAILFVAGMDVHAQGTQSRIIIGSHLVPPKTEAEIPCRCTHDIHPIRKYQAIMTDVEHYTIGSPKVRFASLTPAQARQERIWTKVAEHRETLKGKQFKGKQLIPSGMRSTKLSELQEAATTHIQKELNKVKIRSNQIGIVVVSEGRVRSIEFFDSPKTYKQLHQKLIERLASEIVTEKPTPPIMLSSLRKEMLKQLKSLHHGLTIKDGTGVAQDHDVVFLSLWNKNHQLIHFCMENVES